LAGTDRRAEMATFGNRLGRALLVDSQANGTTVAERPLAVKSARWDPFNDFRKYRGGYDIKSKHYWGVHSRTYAVVFWSCHSLYKHSASDEYKLVSNDCT
jgi:hypothetical protein